jgi:cytidylate kinase
MPAIESSAQSPQIIAIDGPAASGKSTVGAELANRLGYLCLDTGIMYRAVTWQALAEGLDPEDETAITRLAETIEIDVQPGSVSDGRAFDVLINHQDTPGIFAVRKLISKSPLFPLTPAYGTR